MIGRRRRAAARMTLLSERKPAIAPPSQPQYRTRHLADLHHNDLNAPVRITPHLFAPRPDENVRPPAVYRTRMREHYGFLSRQTVRHRRSAPDDRHDAVTHLRRDRLARASFPRFDEGSTVVVGERVNVL